MCLGETAKVRLNLTQSMRFTRKYVRVDFWKPSEPSLGMQQSQLQENVNMDRGIEKGKKACLGLSGSSKKVTLKNPAL